MEHSNIKVPPESETGPEKPGKNKIQAINTYTLPVIRHPAGIVSWTKEEMEAADVKTNSSQCIGSSTPSPMSRDCTPAGKRVDGAW